MTPSVKDYSYYQIRRLDPIFWFLFILIIKGILYVIDTILWLCFGYSFLQGNKEEQERAKLYEQSAHIIRIYGRGTINLFGNHNETNFLYLHDKYVHPSYILEHDNVILMGVDEKRAYFCVSNEGVDPYHSSTGPFLWANTFIAAEKLLVLDIDHFHRLAEHRGNPFVTDNLKITLIHMTARCGSTLLCQILEKVPRVKVMSEPNVFSYICNLYLQGNISYVEYQRLLESTFRLQCKKAKNIDHIVIKWAVVATPAIPFLKEKYPELNLIFNTRNIKETARSIGKVFDWVLPVSMRLSAAATMFFLDRYEHVPIHFDDIKWWKIYRSWKLCTDEDIEKAKFLFYNWWGSIELYHKTKETYLMTILYEDLSKNPKSVINELFKILDISVDHLENAMEALKLDSQQGMFGKRGSFLKDDGTNACMELNKIFQNLNIHISTDMSLEELRVLLK